ncbi:MAG: phosphatidate cytidylyltransferase [Labilithrix sp.]|nr:phosphatidate cytidylyltransferase [Labilithrix sp.]MBX3220275.1 phosphatidate cytidylyltransferase [Labilithrix sp.]
MAEANASSEGSVPAPHETKQQTKKANSNLAVRIATAVVCAPLILLLLYKGAPWGFYLLVLPVTLIAAWELFSMTHPGDRASQLAGVGLAATTSAATYFADGDARVFATLLVGVPLAGPLVTLVRLGDMKTAALRACAMGFGPLFVGVPVTLLAVMRRDLGDAGAGYVVLALMFAWFGDTGGYFAGRFLGRRKLYEAVSPKKTVEGAIGGLAGSVLGAVLAHVWFLPSLPLAHGIPLAVVAGALGQAGDLGESLLKRSFGVKDSGAIVPGHGGILDRVDALMLTSAVTYLYSLWFLAR